MSPHEFISWLKAGQNVGIGDITANLERIMQPMGDVEMCFFLADLKEKLNYEETQIVTGALQNSLTILQRIRNAADHLHETAADVRKFL